MIWGPGIKPRFGRRHCLSSVGNLPRFSPPPTPTAPPTAFLLKVEKTSLQHLNNENLKNQQHRDVMLFINNFKTFLWCFVCVRACVWIG